MGDRQTGGGEIHRCKAAACPLNRVNAGTRVRIKSLSAPPGISQRLREMGLGENQVIKLLVRQSNLICLVSNARMALSSQLAQMILVEPLQAADGQGF
jgi:Fe2+ transport system protein FeoA